MFLRKGIALKTFVFTFIITVTVVLVSFGTLYLVMPDFYLNQKVKSFTENTAEFYKLMEQEDDLETIIRYVENFSIENNAEIYLLDHNNHNLALIYSPSSIILQQENDIISYTFDDDDQEADNNMISIKMIEMGEELSPEGTEEVYVLSDNIEILMAIPVGEYIDIHVHNPDSIRVTDNSDDSYYISYNSLFIGDSNTINLSNTILSSEMHFTDHAVLSSLLITFNLQPIDEAKGVLIALIPYLLLMNMFIGAVFAYFYSKKFSKPIVNISQSAVKMQYLEKGIVSGIRTKDELGELSENLDLLYKKLTHNIDILQDEMEKVQVLEQSKTDFLQAASHELKTPLAGLKGILEGMSDGIGKYKDRDKYLTEAVHLTDKMVDIVYEILYTSKMDTYSANEFEPTNIALLLNEVIEDYSVFINESNIALDLSFMNEPVIIYTDRYIFRTILSNIISNAVRYTDEKKKVEIGFVKENDNVILFVKNTCAAQITNLNRLFEPFYTGSYSRDRNQTGTGLGLYIVKKNLEKLGLRYDFVKVEGGLRFNIYLETDSTNNK